MIFFAILYLIFSAYFAEKRNWLEIPSNSRYRREAESTVVKKTKDDVTWLMDCLPEQGQRLKEYLLELDKSHRVDPDNEISKNVQKELEKIMDTIAQKITEHNPEYEGRIVPMGSSHNGTKIGHPDEFDFVYEHEGLTKALHTRFPTVLHGAVQDLALPRGWTHGGFNHPRFSGIREAGVSHLLQFQYLSSPDQTSLRLSVDFVPMTKVKLEYDSFNPLDLFGHMDSSKRPDSLDHHTEQLIQTAKPECFWFSEQGNKFPQFGLAEKELLSRLSNKSTPKILIRVCKVLTRLLKMHKPRHPQCDVKQIRNYQNLSDLDKLKTDLPAVVVMSFYNLPDVVFNYHDLYPLTSDNALITCSDINETIPDKCMVKSHLIKVIVLSMMLANNQLHEREWTDNDLPHLVISVYLLLLDSVKHKQIEHKSRLISKCNQEPNLFIHLTRRHKKTEERGPATHQSAYDFDEVKERLLWLLDDFEIDGELSDGLQSLNIECPTFYANTKPLSTEFTLFHCADFPITSSRISAAFQIFRSVCEETDVEMVTQNAIEASMKIIDFPCVYPC